MVEKTSQKDLTQPKVYTIVVLLIGSLGMLLLTLGCILDWLKKISLSVDYLVNVLYHPPSGVLSIVFFTILVLFILEKITTGRLEKLLDYINKKAILIKAFILIAVVSLILLMINSVIFLNATTSSTSDVAIHAVLHNLLGMVFGVSLALAFFKTLIASYLKNPIAWQKFFSIGVIIVFIVFLVIVIIGMMTGLIIL
jgi:hypothetical protein